MKTIRDAHMTRRVAQEFGSRRKAERTLRVTIAVGYTILFLITIYIVTL